MARTAFKAKIDHVAAVLLAAGTTAGAEVHTNLVDPLDVSAGKALVVSRGGSVPDTNGIHGGAGVHRLDFEVSAVATGDTWDADADSLLQQAHQALTTDDELLDADIELGPTRPDARGGDVTVGAYIATYTVTVQPDDDLT